MLPTRFDFYSISKPGNNTGYRFYVLAVPVGSSHYEIYASMPRNWSNYSYGWKQNTCYVHKLQITRSNIGPFLYCLRHNVVPVSRYRFTKFIPTRHSSARPPFSSIKDYCTNVARFAITRISRAEYRSLHERYRTRGIAISQVKFIFVTAELSA